MFVDVGLVCNLRNTCNSIPRIIFIQMNKMFTIIIRNTNDAPLNTSLTSTGGQQSYPDDNPKINENSAIGTTVGTLVSLDQDAGQHLAFTLDDDAGKEFGMEPYEKSY